MIDGRADACHYHKSGGGVYGVWYGQLFINGVGVMNMK